MNSNLFFSNKIRLEIKAPSKVKAFSWLVANKRVNINDLLQVRRCFKALNPDHCNLCIKSGDYWSRYFTLFIDFGAMIQAIKTS